MVSSSSVQVPLELGPVATADTLAAHKVMDVGLCSAQVIAFHPRVVDLALVGLFLFCVPKDALESSSDNGFTFCLHHRHAI